ncbi:MAG: c-type cytochrome [Candidatus Binatia bacterium]
MAKFTMYKRWMWQTPIALLVIVSLASLGWSQDRTYGFGRTPTEAEISAWDSAIGPDGKELPAGKGTAAEGKLLYQQKCAACHGETGTEGPQDKLVGGRGTLATEKPLKTIGSYWPYATTIYDYVQRAMPLPQPGSLTANETYALTAYLLYLNGIISEQVVIDAQTLPHVQMPNRYGFIPDPRPDVGQPGNSQPPR